ncbi:oligosaccharide repeat unit polymerase [Planococcus glaciei]|uniref:oligosaccharide repeat unit polymerase n=1 Tax=Planococcus glaciei TaxID=459472 RepID=UPI001C73CBFA|nr:oligosaccharide repeat unit polymerase [Planococcus glaciei]MBX0316837.1 oligosaccharide repeat unit polymerase family protein [Planococcus glaciei]
MKNNFTAILKRSNKIDTFSPYFFLPFILVLYFFTSLFDFYRFSYFNVTESIWPAVFLALLAYYVGVYIADRRDWVFPSFGLSFLRNKTIYFVWVLALIGLGAYLIMLFTGQIGIADESIRRNLDPKLNFLSQLLWFAFLILLAIRITKEEKLTVKKMFIYAIVFGFVMLLFMMMGYRTPLIIMLFTAFIIFHYVIKRIKLSWFLSALLVIGVFFSMFGFMRVLSEDTSKEFNSREQPKVELTVTEEVTKETEEAKINSVPKWVRSLNGESVTGHIVLSKIIEYTGNEGYLNGEIHAGVFSTIMSGEQISPRMKVTEIVNSLSTDEGKYITRPTRTTTPTFMGQLFLDGGYLLVAIGFLIYGIIVSTLYNQVKRTEKQSYQTVAYAFVITVFTVSMHTGLLDLIFILMTGFIILTAAIEKNKKIPLA